MHCLKLSYMAITICKGGLEMWPFFGSEAVIEHLEYKEVSVNKEEGRIVIRRHLEVSATNP